VAALPAPAPTPSSNTPVDGVIKRGDTLTVLFRPDENQLPNGATPALTQLAQRMSRDDSLTLQLLAYAEGDSSNISKARRLSLSRALEVRKVLMELGVRSTRIEVRALGNKHDGADPIDRVDALVTSH
jgi:outer membrane protein OmpA-like peptidoglycan-associated protein